MPPDELKVVIKECLEEMHHECRLTAEEINDLRTVSGFLKRFRNALGNAMMVLILVIILMGVGGVLYLITGGHINLFKMFGIGA